MENKPDPYHFYPHLKPKEPVDPFEVWWDINRNHFETPYEAARAAWEEAVRLERAYGED